jgi:hypothetical protein
MERLVGFLTNGYRFEIKVPTTIYDPLRAEITAYRGKKMVDRIYSMLKSMPKWNIPLQAVLLSKRDDRRMNRAIKTLIDRLPEKEDIPGNYCNQI